MGRLPFLGLVEAIAGLLLSEALLLPASFVPFGEW